MIYLASPYSAPTAEEREANYQKALELTAKLINAGRVVYSPIVHNHPIAVKHGLPTGWEFWQKFDYQMIRASKELWVYQMPGWMESKGVQAERKIAVELCIPITYIPYE